MKSKTRIVHYGYKFLKPQFWGNMEESKDFRK